MTTSLPRRVGSRSYFIANIFAQASALLRYVLLVRLLGAEQLGLAAMLILTAQFFDTVSDTGGDRFLIQDRDGHSSRLLNFLHLVMAGRGGLICAAIALASPLLSQAYRAPQLQTALFMLALAPLIAGFTHLEYRKVQRENDFRKEGVVLFATEAVALIITLVAAVVTRDHTAVVYGQIGRAAAMVLVSHLVATEPYRWEYDNIGGQRFTRFAAPLIANGILLFIGSQGDRVLIGGGLGAVALGHYTAILLLIYYPSAVISRFISGVHLPTIARAQSDADSFGGASEAVASQCILLALSMAVGFTVIAPMFSATFYGAEFQQPLLLFALIGALQSTRFVRMWPTVIAIGVGKSSIVMFNNVARMAALPLAALVLAQWRSIEAAIAVFIFGELLALTVALILLVRAGRLPLRKSWFRTVIYATALGVLVAWAAVLPNGLEWREVALLSSVTLVVVGVLMKVESCGLQQGRHLIKASILSNRR